MIYSVCRERWRRVFCIISQCHSSHVNNGARPRRLEIVVGCAGLKRDIALTRTRWIRKWILDVTVRAVFLGIGFRCDRAGSPAPRYRYSPRALSAYAITLAISAPGTHIRDFRRTSIRRFEIAFEHAFNYISIYAFPHFLRTVKKMVYRSLIENMARRCAKARYLSCRLYLRDDNAAARSLETP